MFRDSNNYKYTFIQIFFCCDLQITEKLFLFNNIYHNQIIVVQKLKSLLVDKGIEMMAGNNSMLQVQDKV